MKNNNYKIIILGPQCSGKTTLKKYLLKENPDLPLREEDEMFPDLNGGTYPTDLEYKENVLRPKLETEIKQSENLIFLSSYCSRPLLQELKSEGFKIIQLVLERDEFNKRNERRMEEEGYDDANVWADHIFNFHQDVRDKGWVDLEINVNQPIEDVAGKVLGFLKQTVR